MINIYAYTYPSDVKLIGENGGLWVKIGDSHRDPHIRMAEQGGASEREKKIVVGTWLNIGTIKRDYELHKVMHKDGLQNPDEATGRGTEWFKLPVANIQEAHAWIADLIDKVGGAGTALKTVKLRRLQKKSMVRALKIVRDSKQDEVNIVANLCPRFGKTIWALSLFNQINQRYGARVMLLPAYWLSVHSSFKDEIEQFREFSDITYVSSKDSDADEQVEVAFKEGRKVVVDLSLHGELEEWKKRYTWLRDLPNNEIFVFADEADFGSHTDNQLEKTRFLFDDQSWTGKFVKVYASGTNIQRIAKNATGRLIDGVLDVAYSQLERTESSIVPRTYYSLRFDGLHELLEENYKIEHAPSWSKIWTNPNKCKKFIEQLFIGMTGGDDMLSGVSLSAASKENIQGIMCFMSCFKKQMAQAKKIIQAAVPDWEVIVLNGDETSNKAAQDETKKAIKWAKERGKKGVLILSNMMGSRSYSVSQIQASVIMYDGGSVDATSQKVSRCLTPGVTWDGSKKERGHIFTFSFDPNRNETIEQIVLAESVQVSRSEDIEFSDALKLVFRSINIFNIDEDGDQIRIEEETMFSTLRQNDNLLKIADVSVRVDNLTDGMFDILGNVTAIDGKAKAKLDKLAPKAPSKEKRDVERRIIPEDEKARKELEKILNTAVRSINRSATTVYNIAGAGDNYRECLELIVANKTYADEYEHFYGIEPGDALYLLDQEVINGPILDIVVQNTKNGREAWF